MRVVVTGATGNVGRATVELLSVAPQVTGVVGLARRRPGAAWRPAKTTFAVADVEDGLSRHFAGADTVVHLAWAIQPSHDEAARWRTSVVGSERVSQAAVAAGVGALVHASSIAAYSPGPKEPVDESWPTHGIPTSSYARHKAYCGRLLDQLESAHPGLRNRVARNAGGGGKSPAGKAVGLVITTLTSPIGGHDANPSPEHPQWLGESERSGGRAAHHPEPLRRIE